MRFLLAMLLCFGGQAYLMAASSVTVSVPGGAGPWDQSLNPAFHYGVGDNLPPVVLESSSSLKFTYGARITVKYISGLVADSSPPVQQLFDANGGPTCCATNTYSGFNGIFPAFYMDPNIPVYDTTLVGTFADDGVIVGTPFAVGDGPLTVVVPSGANQLLLGVNDNLYGGPSPNQGQFTINVSNTTFVPEPGAFLLLSVALLIGGLCICQAGKSILTIVIELETLHRSRGHRFCWGSD